MKKLVLSLIAVAMFFSCKQKPKDYATVSGKITNIDVPADTLYIFTPDKNYVKKIKMNEDGTFQDTLKVKEGKHLFKVGNEYGTLFLKNNDYIKITTDYPKFDENLKFEGDGEDVAKNNMIVEAMLFGQKLFSDESKTPEQIKSEKENFIKDYTAILDKYKVSDSLKNQMKEEAGKQIDLFADYILNKQQIKNKFVGKPLPNFSMEDIDGKKISLSDLKGKPIYIDIWATWCGPCKAELPFLKTLEEEYSDKGITFVSMSVDEPKNKEVWQKFVKEKGLKGYQLFTGDGWQNSFVQDLEVQGIPRFVLIDEKGYIIDPDAPRPSSKEIKGILDGLVQ